MPAAPSSCGQIGGAIEHEKTPFLPEFGQTVGTTLDQQHVTGTQQHIAEIALRIGTRSARAMNGDHHQTGAIGKPHKLEGGAVEGGIFGDHNLGQLLALGGQRVIVTHRFVITGAIECGAQCLFVFLESLRRVADLQSVPGE